RSLHLHSLCSLVWHRRNGTGQACAGSPQIVVDLICVKWVKCFMKHLRLFIVGFGTVGQGLAELLLTKKKFLQQRYGLDILLVSVANARNGFIYRENGLDIAQLLDLAAQRQPLTAHSGIQYWNTALEGLQATVRKGDVLAEATL